MIYIDFDGVIFDTIKRLEEIAGCEIKKFDLKNYGLDLSVFGEDDFYLNTENNYVISKAVYYIRRLIKLDDVTILTKYCSEEEKKNKQKFITNVLNIKYIDIVFVSQNESKQDYLKNCDIIIDDQTDNLISGNLTNILFDSYGLFDKEWNNTENLNIIKTTTWQEIYKHIQFIYTIRQK